MNPCDDPNLDPADRSESLGAEWGQECATCGVKRRREADLFCSDDCAAADWMAAAGDPR